MGATTVKCSKKRVRGPHLALFSPKAPFEEGLRRANEKDRVLASGSNLNQVLGATSIRRISQYEEATMRAAGAIHWSGDIVAFVEPGKTLKSGGKRNRTLDCHAIEYVESQTGKRWIFPIPPEHEEERDAALVTHHPNYTLETDGKNMVVHVNNGSEDMLSSFRIVRSFPGSNGLYFLALPTAVPHGDKLIKNLSAQYLHRGQKIVTPIPISAEGHIYLDGSISTDTPLPISVETPTAKWTVPEVIDIELVRFSAGKIFPNIHVEILRARKEHIGHWSHPDDYHVRIDAPEKDLIKVARLIQKLRRKGVPMHMSDFPDLDRNYRKVDFSEFD